MSNARHNVGWIGLLLLGAVLLAPGTVAAQTAPWVKLEIVDVSPVMVDEFLAVQREFKERARTAGIPYRTVSRTDIFGDPFRFLIMTPLEALASLGPGGDSADADEPAEDDDSADEPDPGLLALENRARQCITGQQTYAMRTLPDVDNPLAGNVKPNIMIVSISRVVRGREQEYLNVMASDFFPHFVEAELNFISGDLTFGGQGGLLHIFYFDDMAALDKGSPVVSALGAAGAQEVNAKLAGLLLSSEQWVARFLPDESHP